MAQPNNKKLSILYILDVLKNYSDENHLLTQADIAKKIYSLYGMELERKSISSNIESLIDYGYDIVKTANGCYLAGGEFEPSEVSFLIDAVFSSKSIDSKHSKTLTNKLSKFLSVYKRKQYNYIYKADEIYRTNNKQLFYTIDVLNQAIAEKKKVQFNYNRVYFDKDVKKHKASKRYVVNPYFLINGQGRYYLVCNYDYFNEIANYKLELITNVKILDEPIKPITQLKGCENGFDIAKYVNENIYMYNSEPVTVVLKIENDYAVNYVQEWFGGNVEFFKKENTMFARIKTNEQSIVYWCLQYGASVELVEPKHVREKLKEVTQRIADKYN